MENVFMLAPDTLLQNRYIIDRLIAKGGMGAVYLARDQRLGSQVALKETLFTEERLKRAFEHEARLLASLRHPALPKVIDHFTESEGQFLVMEFIPGDDLADLLNQQGHAFSIREVLEWAYQLLDVLVYLHGKRPPIIHRDIKPQNLKLTPEGGIILLDFGLAKGAPSQMARVTSVSSILGFTRNYAPPEQIQGTGTDPRSDLYSFAATIYHLSTGMPPIDALIRSTAVVGGQIDPLLPASQVNPLVPDAIADLLMRTMALNRDSRPSTAEALRSLLRETTHAPDTVIIGAEVPTAAEEPAKPIAPKKYLSFITQTLKTPFIVTRSLVLRLSFLFKNWISGHANFRQKIWLIGVSVIVIAVASAMFFVFSKSKRIPDPYIRKIETLVNEKKWAEAEAEVLQALYFGSDRASYHSVYGYILAQQDKWQQAETEYRQAAENEPHKADRHADLADALIQLRNFAGAEEEYREALNLKPDNVDYRWRLADTLLAQKKWEEAESEYRQAVHLKPDYANFHAGLAVALAKQAKMPVAIVEARKAVQLEPDADWTHECLLNILKAQQLWAEAEIAYREWTQIKPEEVSIRLALAGMLERQSKWAEAETEYRKALRLEPNNIRHRLAIAVCLTRQNKWAEAEAEYREIVRLEPKDINRRLGLADSLSRQNKGSEVEAEYRKIIEMQPNNFHHRVRLADFLAEQNKLVQAEALYREAIRMEPEYGNLHEGLAIILGRQGRMEEARREARKAVSLSYSWIEGSEAEEYVKEILDRARSKNQ